MQKLYRYRPLNDFLFKELFYQEIYFASYIELNDPLDLTARINFKSDNEEKVEKQLWSYIFNSTWNSVKSNQLKPNNNDAIKTFHDSGLNNRKRKYFEIIHNALKGQNFVSFDDLKEILETAKMSIEGQFEINFEFFKSRLDLQIERFLTNSYVSCFSRKKMIF